MNDAPMTLFIPLGSDRSNAGLTVRAETVAEVQAILNDLNESDDVEESKLSVLLNSVRTVKAGVDLVFPSTVAQKPQVAHPQAQASPSDAPSCAHGNMTWKAGVSKAGNDYKGWFCPAPYGQTKCPAKFVK